MDEGKVGVECRGYEHEVNFVWSIASGKKLITDDGKEVHFNAGGRPETKFQHSWVGSNNQVFTIVANASPPLKSRPGYKQFELFIDGVSFDSFPRIFELSKNFLKRRSSSRLSRSHASYSEHRSDVETTRNSLSGEMQWAQKSDEFKSEQMLDKDTTHQPKAVVEPVDLLSAPPEQPKDLLFSSIPTLETASLWDSQNSCGSYQINCNPSKPPSYDVVWNSIMDAYDAVDCENTIQQPSQTTIPNVQNLRIDTSFPNEESYDEKLSTESPKDVAGFDVVLNNLVNLDDISSPVYKGYTQETFEKNQKKNVHSLAELKNMQNQSISRPTKEVMKNHDANAANHSGAMVVHGQPQHSYSYNTYTYSAPPVYGSSYGTY